MPEDRLKELANGICKEFACELWEKAAVALTNNRATAVKIGINNLLNLPPLTYPCRSLQLSFYHFSI